MGWQETHFLGMSGSEDGTTGHRNYTLEYLVYYKDRTTTAADARFATGIPRRKQALPSDPMAYCNGVSWRQTPDDLWEEDGDLGQTFHITCTFTSDPNQQKYENPLDEPPKFYKRYVEFQRDIEKDPVTNEAIVDTAGQPFLNATTRDDAREIHIMIRNEPYSAYDRDADSQYNNVSNEDEWNGYEPGQALCKPIGRDPASALIPDGSGGEFILHYWVTTYEVHTDKLDGFKAKYLSQGFKYKDPDDGEVKLIMVTNEDGERVQSPVPRFLAANGDILPDDGEPHALEFNRYPRVSFEPLNMTLPGG